MLIASLRLTIKQLLVFIFIFWGNFYKVEIRWRLAKQWKAHMKNTYADMKRLCLFCFLCSSLTLNVIQSHLKQAGIKSLDRGVTLGVRRCSFFCKRYSVKRVWWGVCFPLLLHYYFVILYFIPFLDILSPLWSFTVNVLMLMVLIHGMQNDYTNWLVESVDNNSHLLWSNLSASLLFL